MNNKVYKYGIDITNATLQTKAYELGISKAVSEMTQAEKQQLRIIAILDQSKVAWGDLANTVSSPSNQIRIFNNNIKETGLILGQLFIPMLEKVLPIANGVTIALKRLLVEFASFLGIQINLDKFGQGYTDLEEGVEDLTDGYDDLADAMQEAKLQAMDFDEINPLKADSSGSGSGGTSSGIDLTADIIASTQEYEEAWKKAFDNMESQVDSIADVMYDSFKDVLSVISPLTDVLFNDIKWGNVADSMGEIADVAKAFTKGFTREMADTIGDVVNSISKMVDIFADLLGIAPAKVYETLGKAIADLVIAIATFKVVTGVSTIISGLNKPFKTLVDTLSNNKLAVAASLLVGLYFALEDFIAYEYEPNLIELSDDIQELYDNFSNLNSELDQKAEDRLKGLVDSAKDYEYVGKLADKYFELKENVNKTAGEAELMERRYQDLIAISPDFKKILDDETLTYDEQRDAIQDVISELQKKARTEAAYSYLVEIEKDRLKTEQELQKVLQDERYDVDRLKDAWLESDKAVKEAEKAVQNFIGTEIEKEELEGRVRVAEAERTKRYKEYATALGVVEEYQEKINELDSEYEYYTGIVTGANDERIISFEKLGSTIKDSAENFADDFINGFSNAFKMDSDKIKKTIEDTFEGFKAKLNIEAILGGGSNKGMWGIDLSKVLGFAGGGYVPSSYTMFMAGENGIPEMLGTIGGKTAVAGGAEITGIREEIRNTASEEIALLRQQNALLQGILEKEFGISERKIFQSVQNQSSLYTMQTGKSAFM